MDGKIDYAALPVIAEILGIDDVEAWLLNMLVIRQFMSDQDG